MQIPAKSFSNFSHKRSQRKVSSPWLWSWHRCWYMEGWFEYFNCWSRNFTHKKVLSVHRMVQTKTLFEQICEHQPWWAKLKENDQAGPKWQEAYGSLNRPWPAKKHFSMHSTPSSGVDELQQQKTISGLFSVDQELESEVIMTRGTETGQVKTEKSPCLSKLYEWIILELNRPLSAHLSHQ